MIGWALWLVAPIAGLTIGLLAFQQVLEQLSRALGV